MEIKFELAIEPATKGTIAIVACGHRRINRCGRHQHTTRQWAIKGTVDVVRPIAVLDVVQQSVRTGEGRGQESALTIGILAASGADLLAARHGLTVGIDSRNSVSCRG